MLLFAVVIAAFGGTAFAGMRLLDAGPDAAALRAERARADAAFARQERRPQKRKAGTRKKATAAAPAAAAAPSLEPGHVYLMPLDGFPLARARALASHVQRKLRVRVSVTGRRRSPAGAWYAGRKQIAASAVTRIVLARSRLVSSPETTLIGLTNRDMFIPGESWKFAFSLRDGQVAVVSSARMDPAFLGLPADPALAFERLRKMVIKDVSIVHFGDFESEDKRSVLYGDVLGTDDLDFMTEDVEPRESRAQRRWIGRADSVCTDWQVAALVLGAKAGPMKTTAQVYRFLERAVPLNERFARRFLRLRPAPEDRRLHGRLVSELHAMLREDRSALRSLSPRSSTDQFGRAFASSIKHNVVMQSLALRLGSEGCGVLFDPAPIVPGS